MAAPETVHEPATLQYNTYTPVKGGDLGGSHLFGGAGELWAKVGDTALRAAGQLNQTAGMMMQSPLNPAVKAQMQESVDRANLGRAAIAHAMANPDWRNAVTGETPQGATMIAPATLPVSQATQWDLDQQDGNPPPVTQPKEPPKESKEPPKETKPKSHQEEMGQVSYPGNLYASSQPGIPAGYQGGGSGAAAQEGTPASMTFLNPATGNVEPLQTPAPASLFASRAGAPAPPAPTAPPPQQPVARSQAPAAATQADQAAMQQWQQQNAHPVMSSQDALGWMKNQTTLAQDATYLPMGGPDKGPAFAFHMKGGGMNIVPVSQMVQKGAGPLVASQNTSQVISATDQQQPGATSMPSGTGMGAPQGQPATGPQAPPAPGPAGPQPNMLTNAAPYPTLPGMQDAWTNQLLTQPIPTANGAAPPAPGGPRLIPVQATTTHPAAPAIATAASPPIEAPPASAQAEARPATQATATTPIPTPPDQVAELNNDAIAPKPKRVWQPDDTGRFPGTSFTAKPSGRAGFYEQRYYRGSPGWEDGLWTPDNVKRQEVLDTYGSASSNIPRGEVLDFDQVKNKSMPEIDALLTKAVWWRNHSTGMAVTGPDQTRLNMEANASKHLATLLDMQEWAKQNNMDPKVYNENEILHAYEAATRDGILTKDEANKALGFGLPQSLSQFVTGVPRTGERKTDVFNLAPPGKNTDWWSLAQYAYHDAFSGFQHSPNAFAQAVGSKLRALTSTLEPLPEYQGRAITSKDWPTHHVGLVVPDWNVDLSVPVASDPSKIQELNSMVQGAPLDEAIRNYGRVKSQIDQQYIKDVKNLAYAGFRVPDDDINNMTELSKPDGRIKDDNNPMREKGTNKIINPYGPPPGGQSASASPTPSPTPASPALPQIRSYDTEEFNRLKIKKGDQYLGPDGHTIFTRGQ